ncbi:hypothetical protein DAMNIGENAA_21740 [Desulforhabdus amnigena]|uniref:Uncharacterized protein n=2 Tax=Desulforhabdus amnigena TaxID=40218 RepID=A0A9W6CZP5_9BACT|nr:hypothetical protein DAMNIGENAA_21740 [Desulforhabdus amnigena]
MESVATAGEREKGGAELLWPESLMPLGRICMKIEVRCKQCGRHFVKYSYSKTARCEECRRFNREAIEAKETYTRHCGLPLMAVIGHKKT